jgi:hypothetical protein
MQAINAMNLNKSTSIPCMERLLNYTHGDTTLIGIIEKRHLKFNLLYVWSLCPAWLALYETINTHVG